MEADLAPGHAPAITNATSAAAMRQAGEFLGVLAQHLLDGSDPGSQTEALNPHLAKPSQGGRTRERRNCANSRLGVGLLCGFDTPSLMVQGGQRLLPKFNSDRGNLLTRRSCSQHRQVC